ncbi:hypothetical protein SAMN05421743_101387 [Thalassobacillus cyri]|uniref:ABC-2 type transport system permease protein n=1 Tax=Thalassobacillus cyri TaxID=571932 RepID=A0A1H3WB43_9BACI|nr:hypothetical protein [Thalassobacillus cyri]SDZ84200.1 hypothetical protein SAMN05421743_101387 [Thalassobacillus cyri]
MRIFNLLKSNLLSLFFHFIVIGIAGILNLEVWSRVENKNLSLAVLIFSLVLYFILGLFLEYRGSVKKNILTVVLIPVFSLLLYLGTLLPASSFEGSMLNSFNFLYFVTIQPFLNVTGIPANFDYPLLFAIVPALMLWFGLQVKTIFKERGVN